MLIVDAHVHLWANSKPNAGHRQVPELTAEQLIAEMDEAGVDAAVIQPPNWDPTSNEVAVEAARRHPKRYAVLGWFPLDKPESRALIDGWKKRPGMLGLRFTFLLPQQQSWPTDGTMDWLWPAAEKAGLPIALGAANFLPLVGKVAEQHPGLRLVIDHLGLQARTKDAAAFANLPAVLALAKHPNIAVKATGAAGYSSEPYPFRNIHALLKAIYDAFGPERMFWGTDITRMSCSWRECVTLFTEELDFLSARDKELVMGEALCRWLGWDLVR
ncbi:MAG: amidohydrolase family protein [Stellaceae bacterium]